MSTAAAPEVEPSTADAIPVEKYDLTLVWPLLLKDLDDGRSDDPAGVHLEKWVEEICKDSAWRDVCTPFPWLRDPSGAPRGEAETEYAEFVYFHPFVRNFLYTNREDIKAHVKGGGKADDAPNRNMRVLERTDLKSLEVGFYLGEPVQKDVQVALQVRRTLLFLFDTRVVLLAVMLERDQETQHSPDKSPEGGFTLQTVLKLQDVVRRVYTPFWESANGWHRAGRCPASLRAVLSNGQTRDSYFGAYPVSGGAKSEEIDARNAHLDHVTQHREPHAVSLWTWLMEPVTPVHRGDEPVAGKCNLHFEQIEDERLALFSYLAVRNPRRITTGDWLRLATVDDPGDSERYPYSPQFIDEKGLQQYCYDRFWCPTGDYPEQSYYTTRWLCCGYGFTAVGAAGDGYYYTNQRSGARAHFRYHYFKMGLIAHFHRASLLAYKHDLAEAVEALRDNPDPVDARLKFQEKVTRIEEELLTFRNMYWFTEVSNQIQGRELFDLWSKHLNTRELFNQVYTEAREASQVIVGWNTRRLGDLTARLAVIATGFLVLAPILASLDYNFQVARWVATLLIGFSVLLVIVRTSRGLAKVIDRLAGSARALGSKSTRAKNGKKRLSLIFTFIVAFIFCAIGIGLLWWVYSGRWICQMPYTKDQAVEQSP